MPDYYSEPTYTINPQPEGKKPKNKYFIHLVLFLITFITTLIAGMEWTTGSLGPYDFNTLGKGLPYALSMLFILATHEFGHYFASRFHGVDATLPYFIPFPPIPGFFHFGTMGAVIKTRSRIPDNKAMFDIGVAGPISGFIACLIILIYGFTHLPGIEYLQEIHPDYLSPEYGKGAMGLEFGDTLLFMALRELFTQPGQFVPPMSEIYHYPFLCVGWFGLFITAMNMIPVGQLDGGHIVYSMFGSRKHEIVASISMVVLIFLGVAGVVEYILEIGFTVGWTGWLFWAIVLYFVIKVKHPPVFIQRKLGKVRMTLGYIALIILILSFSPTPFILSF